MKQISYIIIVVAAVCWGSIGLFTKKLSIMGFNESEMLFIKVVLGTFVLLPVLLYKDKKLLYLKQPMDIRYFLGTGIISFAFFSLCYMRAIEVTSLGVAAVLLYTAPTIVMVFSILLFGERLTGRKVFTLFTTFVGCVLVTGIFGSGGSGGSITTWGLLLGLGAGLGYALYSVFGALALRRGYHSMTITFYTFFTSAVFLLFLVRPISLLTRITELRLWPTIIAFSAITTIIPYAAYTAGLSHVRASRASIMATMEPVVAAMIGILVFHENAKPQKLAGMALVLCAIFFMGAEENKVENQEKGDLQKEL